MNCAIILILIAILISLYLLNSENIKENFSSDEAIQNIASLYNQSKLTVTDFVSTGNSNFKNMTATGTSIMPIINSNNITATGAIKADSFAGTKGALTAGFSSGSLTTGPLTAGQATLGPTTISGDGAITGKFSVGGLTDSLKEKLFIIETPYWDKKKWIQAITTGNYFTKSMPNGTLLKFLFIYTDNGKYSYSYSHAIKVGNIFLYTEQFEVTGLQDPSVNASNDLGKRGNIN